MNLTGRSLKQYQLVAKLGAGGMGVVYRARDTILDRDVAVKVLPPDALQSEEARNRFLREARAASQLNHPNVVTIYEVGCDDGIDFIAMEYVPGNTLQWLLRQRRLSVSEAASYAYQTASALAKAHAAGVVHRDIKPGNLVVTDEGLVKVLDFGLARLQEARLLDDDSPTRAAFATRAGTVLGTVAYMSPEQARGEEAGPPSDVFSLGVVLFEMLSGQLPFAGGSDLARLHNLHFAQPKDLRVLSPDVPDGLAGIVVRMIEKDLAVRYAGMEEVRRDLRTFSGGTGHLTGLPAAPEPSANQPASAASAAPAPSPSRRGLAIGVVLLLLIGAGVATWRFGSVGPAVPPASGSGATVASGSVVGEPAIDTATATPFDLYQRARALLDRFDRDGNVAQAITLLEAAVARDPDFAVGFATLAEAYRYRFRQAPDEQWRKLMAQSADRAIALNPELGAAHVAIGIVRMGESGKAAEAEAAFQRAIDLDPRNPEPHRWMMVLASANRQDARARQSAARVLELAPRDWRALQELGVIHYRSADYAQAAAVLEQARASSPDNVRVLANLAAAYHMLDRYEDAASTLQRAIEIAPAASLFTNLGTLRYFQGRYAEAVPPFEKALDLLPNRYASWGNLADAYRWSPAHKAKAGETYARAIQLVREQLAGTPGATELRAILGLYLAKSGDTGAALEAIGPLERQPPSDAAVLFQLAVTYDLAGRRDAALGALEQALAAGYAEREVRAEPELVGLRADVRYHRLIAAHGAATRR